jgi:hypothetical protein
MRVPADTDCFLSVHRFTNGKAARKLRDGVVDAAADTIYGLSVVAQHPRRALRSGTGLVTQRDVAIQGSDSHGFFRHLFFARFGH